MTESNICQLTNPESVQSWEASPEHIGGKAASLLTMRRAGLPVPPACVIPIPVCAQYFAEGQSLSAELMRDIRSAVHSLEVITGKTLGQGPRDLQLAVRSGAAASMPGTLESVLRVKTWNELQQAMRTVLNSWMSPAAVAYRQASRLEHLRGTAVLLQQMIDTELAGVLFTRDPLGRQSDDLIIEGIPGTGERLVSGAATGTQWTISRQSLEDAGQPMTLAESSPLDVRQLRELATYGLQIEQLFRQPVDIEWGLSNDGQWHFFQARPISFRLTGADTKSARTDARRVGDAGNAGSEALTELLHRENLRLEQFRRHGDVVWVRHNLCETLPFPTPLTWSIWREFLSGAGGYGRLYRLLGFRPSRRICQQGFAELIGGQIFVSPQRLPDLFCVDFPFSYPTTELRHDPTLIDQAPNRLDLDRVGPWFLLRSPWILWILWRARRRVRWLQQHALRTLNEGMLPAYRQYLANEQAQRLEGLSTSELVLLLQRRMQRILLEFYPQLLLPGVVGAAALEMLRQRVQAISDDEQAAEFCQILLQKLPVSPVTDLRQAVDRLRRGQLSEPEFLARYGHRARQEMELAEPRWRETPDQIPNVMSSAAAVTPPGVSDAERISLMEEMLQRPSIAGKQPRLQNLLADVIRLLPYREICKQEFLRGYALLRDVTQALGRQTGLGDDVYFLTWEELGRCDRETAIRLVTARRRERELWRQCVLPAVIDESVSWPAQTSPADAEIVLQGRVISAGSASGTAWFPDQHPRQLPPTGAILVCGTLPPHFVAFFTDVAGAVVDQSSLLSHGAILARQFGIPVICHLEATRVIREGDTVTVNGNAGEIRLQRRSDSQSSIAASCPQAEH